jgi:hypothetical protein
VGASPIRQSLQPEAIGAVIEVTKWLKPHIAIDRMMILPALPAFVGVCCLCRNWECGADIQPQARDFRF